MKLGIAVVYLVLPGDEALLDLHLESIERCTQVPFTIYAAVNRLEAPLVERLSANPFVRLCSIPSTEERGSLENAYYLERLIAQAIDDGNTHVATLHVDSFPIRTGWADQLEQRVSSQYAFAAAVREEDRRGKPTTAGLFFPREFYMRYRPRLLLSRADMGSRLGREYAKGLRAPGESGTGYGYAAVREGLQWLELRRTNRTEDHDYYGTIHGDVIFHLGAAAHDGRSFPGSSDRPRLTGLRQAVARWLPRSVKEGLRRLIPEPLLFPEFQAQRRSYDRVKEALLEDPAGYIARLQATIKKPGGDPDEGADSS